MENNVGDMLHCEEQLRTTLHCDDKEKLRRKLLLLQREYLRTAQRLQRAERSEAVRRHVRNKITEQNQQDQRDPEVTSNPCLNPPTLTLDSQNGTASGEPPCQGSPGGAAESQSSRRSSVIRFLLPTDDACPQTPDPGHDAARSHRPTSALRLRSQRSRLRWEKRTAEAGRSTDNSEEGQEQSERMKTAAVEASEERVKTDRTEVVNENEALSTSAESNSPSLLLIHWNTCECTETGKMEGKEKLHGQEQMEKETELMRAERKKESKSTSLPLTCLNCATNTERREQNGTKKRGRKEIEGGEEAENSREQREGRLCEDSLSKHTEQNTAEQIEREKSHDKTVEVKEDKSEAVGAEHHAKDVGLMDSCTLVEGLLFPAEYYVRTTRRMSSSQSMPDMQAVILSQLSMGRPRKSRGRGRGLNRSTHCERSDLNSQADFSRPATSSPSVGPRLDMSELNSPSSSEISEQISGCLIDTDACFSPTVTAARPGRGRRRRRGRGRGRPQTPRCTPHLSLRQTLDDPQPTSSPVLSHPLPHGADIPKPSVSPREAIPVPDDSQPVTIHNTATQPSSGGNGSQMSSASGHPVYPIFLKSSGRTNKSTQMRFAESWQKLLLPSSPPAQTSLLPLPSLYPSPLVNNLMSFDIQQDFHLPDDQFASLKLHKLHQVAAESGVEHYPSPSYNTRRSIRRSESCPNSSDTVMSLPLSLSLTPTISNSPTEAKQTAVQSEDLEKLSDKEKLTSQSEWQTHTTPKESVVEDRAAQNEDEDVLIESQSSISASNTNRSIDQSVKPQPHISVTGEISDYVNSQSDEVEIKESSVIPPADQTDHCGSVCSLEDQTSTNHQTEDKVVTKTLSFEEASHTGTAVQTCNDTESPGESPVQSPAEVLKDSSELTTTSPRINKHQVHHSVQSQLLLSPSLASAPHLRSSALPSSLALPSLGLTPHPAVLPLTSSPSAPALTLPPPHSPSIQALSPPALSPCPSLTSLPHSQPPSSPTAQIQASSEPPQTAEPATVQSQGSGGEVRIEETAKEHEMRCTYTLKAPAGGCLVDACCFPGSSGGLCVAAAGKWAVCLWSQTSASDWSLTHTWVFNEPVINVFPVPDAVGLMCVTLGQLEIREVRMLSCSSLSQSVLCEGLVQAVAGVSKSRVVTSSHSTSGSTLQVFTLSDSGSTLSSHPLVSPGVCVGAFAPVDGLSDALIGTDEGGCLFVWNVKTGQLLRRVNLTDGLSHTACLRGYSYCGVLFVLLQHQLLSPLTEEEREAAAKDQMFLEEEEEEEERKKNAQLSLVAVNPLNGKSVLATRLCPPKAWSSRLCEADVNSSSVVGLSQSGCVCVWELGHRAASRMVWAPESEGWQLARWGAEGTLVTGHHNGDVTLHCHNTSQTSPCH